MVGFSISEEIEKLDRAEVIGTQSRTANSRVCAKLIR